MTHMYDPTIDGARRAAALDDLGRWVQDFLASEGSDNAELGEQLADDDLHWAGPLLVEFDELHRFAGPPSQPTMTRLTDEDQRRVSDMVDSLDDGWRPAPCVATHKGDHLSLEDGNHRVEALRRHGDDRWWTVVGFDSDDARRSFLEAHPTGAELAGLRSPA